MIKAMWFPGRHVSGPLPDPQPGYEYQTLPPGRVPFVLHLDTRCLNNGTGHAPELEGMHYKYFVAPAEQRDNMMPQDKLLEFHPGVTPGLMVAVWATRAKDPWEKEASEWKASFEKDMTTPLTPATLPQTVMLLDAMMAPEGWLHQRQKAVRDQMEQTFSSLADINQVKLVAEAWALAMAMKACEAWHTTQEQT